MSATLWIASSEFLCVHPDGTERRAVARLASPTRRAGGGWASAYAVEGLSEIREMPGSDSLQAMSMVRAVLERFVDQGGQILDPGDRTDFPIEATFGLLGAAESDYQ